MKISLLLILLGAALYPRCVPAQPLEVPAASIAEADRVLTPDFVRESEVILVGRLSPSRRSEGIASVGMTGFEMIRGEQTTIGRGLVMPTGEPPARGAALALIFARFDPARQQAVVSARLEATPENIERATALANENQKITVVFSAGKTIYAPDESVVLKWQARNTSPTTQRVYVGKDALHRRTIYGGRAHGSLASGASERQESDYITLAPGEEWSTTQTIKGPFPEGEMLIEATLDSGDNYLGAPARGAADRAAKERLEGVALFKAMGAITVEIKAP